MKKRILSILLCVCMAITMMPAATLTAWATDPTPVTELWVGTTQVVQSGGTVTANTSGTGWSYDHDAATLTLNGANITTISHDGVTGPSGSMDWYYYYGIYCYGDLNIVVTGDSAIDARAAAFNSSGIYIRGNLSVSGSAELTAKGNWQGLKISGNLTVSGAVTLCGIADKTGYSGSSIISNLTGIMVSVKESYWDGTGRVTVSDTASLTGHASVEQKNCGMECPSGNIAVDSGATLTATADDGYSGGTGSESYGLKAGYTSGPHGQVGVAGTLVASAGDAGLMGSSGGLYLYNTDLVVSGNGGVRAESGESPSPTANAYGVCASGGAEITVNGGGFLASGGTCAVYPATTNVTINGTPVYYEVGANRDGSGAIVCTDTETWNSTYNGNFGAYKYINATTVYEVYINGTQITRVNRHDVLGDGTVSYVPPSGSDPAQLTLNGASLSSVQLDGDSELSLTGTNTVGTVTNVGVVTVSGDGGLTLTGSLDCGSENLTVESSATLTLQGAVTSGAVVNNGTLVNNNATPTTLPGLTNNGSFSNTGAGSLTVDTITGSGIITNEGTLILPSSVEEETAERITGEGLTEVRGAGAPSVYYTNGTRLISAPGAMDFMQTAAFGGWSESATLETNGYTWNADTKILTLQNLLAQISGDHAITVPSGTAVTVEGINILSSDNGAGIYGDGILIIQGDGTLRASGDDGGLLADRIKVAGNVDAAVNGIDNSSKTEPSVEVSGNASLTSTKSIKTGSFLQSGSASVSVNGNSLHGIMTEEELHVDGGNLTVSSDIAAVMAEGGILLGSGRGVLTPSGGKIAAAEVTIGGITHTYTTILPSGVNTHTAELSGSIINSNGARNVVIGTAPVTPSSGSGGGGGSTAGDAATVSLTDAQLKEITAGSSDSLNFSIDASKLGSKAVVIPAKIVSTVNGSSDDKGLEVIMPAGTVILDKTALEAVSGKGDVKLSVETIANDKLTNAQKAALGTQAGSAVIVDVNIEVNGIKTGTFGGGTLGISVPYTLKQGESKGSITVWFIKDDGTIEPKNGTYNAATSYVEFTTNHLSQYVIVKFPFADVAEKAWYYGSVAYAWNNGLFSGTSEVTFSPKQAMSRQMIWMVLARMDGKAPTNMAEAKAWAVENKISDGSNPKNTITRGQMATILYRYAQYKKHDTTQGGMAIREFADYSSIPAYAQQALGWTVNTGLLQGSGDKLMPQGSATRAQVAAILQRFSEYEDK